MQVSFLHLATWETLFNDDRLARGARPKWDEAQIRNYCELRGIVEDIPQPFIEIKYPRCVLTEEVQMHSFARIFIDLSTISLLNWFLPAMRKWCGLVILPIGLVNIILDQRPFIAFTFSTT